MIFFFPCCFLSGFLQLLLLCLTSKAGGVEISRNKLPLACVVIVEFKCDSNSPKLGETEITVWFSKGTLMTGVCGETPILLSTGNVQALVALVLLKKNGDAV